MALSRMLDNSLLKLARAKDHALKAVRRSIRHRDARASLSRFGLLQKRPNVDYAVTATQEYWKKHYGKAIDPMWHIAITNVVGKADSRYIPHDIWYEVIRPYFNKLEMRHVYIDKNLARRLLCPESEVRSLIKRMHGAYYTNDYVAMPRDDVISLLRGSKGSFIVKGSGTDDGSGIRLIELESGQITLNGSVIDLSRIENLYGHDFAIQPRVSQHLSMAAPHPDSVNTVRLVTLRWKDRICVLLAFMRIGVGGKITDNAGTGGICRGVEQHGRLSVEGVDAHGRKYTVHPSTGFKFGTADFVPGYAQMCEYAIELHGRVQHFDLISWDFIVSEKGTPVFLEMNFQGASYVYQFATGKPIFGELTADILSAIRSSSG